MLKKLTLIILCMPFCFSASDTPKRGPGGELLGILKKSKKLHEAGDPTSQLGDPDLDTFSKEYANKKSTWYRQVWPEWLDLRERKHTDEEFKAITVKYMQARHEYVESRDQGNKLKADVISSYYNSKQSLNAIRCRQMEGDFSMSAEEERAAIGAFQKFDKQYSRMVNQEWYADCSQSLSQVDEHCYDVCEKQRHQALLKKLNLL